MSKIDGTWMLYHAGHPAASLIVTEIDFPWMRGRFEALPAYDGVRGLFEQAIGVLDAEEYEAFDEVYGRIRAVTSMTFPDGTQVAEYLLNVHGDGTCGWRWDDEPDED